MALAKLNQYFIEKPSPLKTAHTIQIVLLRQTHDYAVFRTEETRELNVVTLPKSPKDPEPVLKVAMLASKQKAAESRQFATLWKTLAQEHGVAIEQCYLKDNLCRKCPRCILFGAVSTESGSDRWNIKHRIEYSTAYSIEPYEMVSELITFNAVEETTQSTGQALGFTENVQALVNFPSIVTLQSVTKYEFILALKTILSTTSYGAESRIKGDMRNYPLAIIAGFEEVITPLELTVNLSQSEPPYEKAIPEILDQYVNEATFKDKVTTIYGEELESLIREVQEFTFTKEIIEKMKEDSESFISEFVAKGKSKKKKK